MSWGVTGGKAFCISSFPGYCDQASDKGKAEGFIWVHSSGALSLSLSHGGEPWQQECKAAGLSLLSQEAERDGRCYSAVAHPHSGYSLPY